MSDMPKRIFVAHWLFGSPWRDRRKHALDTEYIRADAIDTEALANVIVNGPIVDWDAPSMGRLYNDEVTRVKRILDTALEGGERGE